MRRSDTPFRTTAPVVVSAAAVAGIGKGAAAAVPAAPAANSGSTQRGDTDKIDVGGKESLVNMLKESHALLISDTYRLRADLEACPLSRMRACALSPHSLARVHAHSLPHFFSRALARLLALFLSLALACSL